MKQYRVAQKRPNAAASRHEYLGIKMKMPGTLSVPGAVAILNAVGR